MCTIISKNHLIGKNFDSIVNAGMMFTNKRGLIKKAAGFPSDRPLEWVSSYGSITFSQSGKEMPVSGINEKGLVVEQAALLIAEYPEHEGKRLAGSLEAIQYLLDTCGRVEQALAALERFAIARSSCPIRFALFDSDGNMAVMESEHQHQEIQMKCGSVEETFHNLHELRRPDTIWSHVYDLSERKLYLKRAVGSEAIVIEMDRFDFSPRSRNLMLDIKENDDGFQSFTEEANRRLISGYFNHPAISQIMKVQHTETMINFIADQTKNYDITNEIVLRFLDGEQIKQLPIKEAHKIYVLKYLASKFEAEKEYSEGQVNAIIDAWHTFGDYFILRRGLIDSGLLKRLPNGSKYWREIK